MDARLMRWLLPLLLCAGHVAQAQEWIVVPPSRRTSETPPVEGTSPVTQPGQAVSAPGGVVRVLDKINGTVTDFDLASGETAELGLLSVTMGECRAPVDNPAGDAFALVSIRTTANETALFEGWLIASAPALNAMDHPRYDAWALRCTGLSLPTPETEPNAP